MQTGPTKFFSSLCKRLVTAIIQRDYTVHIFLGYSSPHFWFADDQFLKSCLPIFQESVAKFFVNAEWDAPWLLLYYYIPMNLTSTFYYVAFRSAHSISFVASVWLFYMYTLLWVSVQLFNLKLIFLIPCAFVQRLFTCTPREVMFLLVDGVALIDVAVGC